GGLLSTDFVRRGEGEGRPPAGPCLYGRGLHSEWEVIDLEAVPADAVGDAMTRDPVTAGPHAGIGELARTMRDAHIHRVIILDGNGRPVGVGSSTDILAAVARLEQP